MTRLTAAPHHSAALQDEKANQPFYYLRLPIYVSSSVVNNKLTTFDYVLNNLKTLHEL